MNIFATSPAPALCAQALDDKRVVKMTLESAQIICTRLIKQGRPAPYKPTHQNHPIVIWAGPTINYVWLLYHFRALSEEYTHRYGRVHKSWQRLQPYITIPPILQPPESFCNCSGQPNNPDVFEAYRECLREKWRNDKREPVWTNRSAPSWATPKAP